ncbi:hypothetical protein K440DRAFT_218441 [Wilcoxina mikolae CBS 423.85]|nr:hypothetical protein K440DRAFT_218441 [Wilcoxina mikolae CBS 423.85]
MCNDLSELRESSLDPHLGSSMVDILSHFQSAHPGIKSTIVYSPYALKNPQPITPPSPPLHLDPLGHNHLHALLPRLPKNKQPDLPLRRHLNRQLPLSILHPTLRAPLQQHDRRIPMPLSNSMMQRRKPIHILRIYWRSRIKQRIHQRSTPHRCCSV